MRYQPRPYQQLIIDKIINTPRCAIFAGMGMGKTSSTLFAIDFLRMLGEVNKVLVLAPLRVAQTTWPDEVRKWRGDLSLRISAVVGSKAQRMAALRRAADVNPLAAVRPPEPKRAEPSEKTGGIDEEEA